MQSFAYAYTPLGTAEQGVLVVHHVHFISVDGCLWLPFGPLHVHDETWEEVGEAGQVGAWKSFPPYVEPP